MVPPRAFLRVLCVLTAAFAFLASPAGAIGVAPGDLDSLNADITGSHVAAILTQPDGKIVIAGSFSAVLGTPRNNIARLNADGSLDGGFDPNANGSIHCLAVQADGKLILAGEFTALQPNGAASPSARLRIARMNGDGSLDTSFSPTLDGAVFALALQSDGKILAGGSFAEIASNGAAAPTATRSNLARFTAEGLVDASLDVQPDAAVRAIGFQADGKVVIGGSFSQVVSSAGTNAYPRAARIGTDGVVDAAFNPNVAGGSVHAVFVQADGKILIGGDFTQVQGTVRQNMARVGSDGALDTTFNPRPNDVVKGLALQADGKIVLGGAFLSLQPNSASTPTVRHRSARVNADGTLDTTFDVKIDASGHTVQLQPDGKLLLGGEFANLQPNSTAAVVARGRFARVATDPGGQYLTATSAARVLWVRSGAAPEVSRAAFDLSTDGGLNWSFLGNGSRVGATAAWELSGLSLPLDGMLRVRACTAGSAPVPVVQTGSYVERARDFSTSAGASAVTLSLYYGGGGNVVVPGTVGWKPVTTIDRLCFTLGGGITSLTLPASVTGIDSQGFLTTPELAEIILEPGNKGLALREGVLFDARFIGAIICPPKKTGACNLPAGLWMISDYAFANCKLLTAVSMPASLTSIGNNAFKGCDALGSVVIPEGVSSIGLEAFNSCAGITSVSLPASLISLGARAFGNCAALQQINVHAANTNFTSSGGVLFTYGRGTLIQYPGGKTGPYTISGSTSIIGASAFESCTGLSAITIPASALTIRDYAFYGCTGLGSVQIPNGVTSIGNGAFGGCTALGAVTLPSALSTLGGVVFAGSPGVSSFTISGSNAAFSTVDGVLFNKAKTSLIAYPPGKAGSYAVPAGVTSIGSSAFYSCTGLTGISFPAGLSSIGGEAFSGCTGLTSVAIPSGIATIENSTFEACSSLASVTIPSTVTKIGSFSFNSSGLTSVTIPNSVTNLGSFSFANCRQLVNLTLSANISTFGSSAFQYCTALTTLTIPEGITMLPVYTFEYCSGLTSVALPSSLSEIRSRAFSGCTSLLQFTTPASAPFFSVQDGVLFNKNKTTLMFYPAGKTGAYTIPASVTTLNERAFAYCAGLSSIILPASVTSIGNHVFYSCPELSIVRVSGPVNSIGLNAFAACGKLAAVVFLGNAPQLSAGAFAGAAEDFAVYFDQSALGFTAPLWKGYPSVRLTQISNPEIVVESPAGTSLSSGSASLDFGTMLVGQAVSRTLLVRNTGTLPLSGVAASFTGAAGGDFTAASSSSATVMGGAVKSIELRVIPTTAGTRSASVQIASNDADENPFSVGLSASATTTMAAAFAAAGEVPWRGASLNAGALSFGTFSIGFVPQQGTQLRLFDNTGSDPITGSVAGLTQGALVTATYQGATYTFQASYTGGDGNDLVLLLYTPPVEPTIQGRTLADGSLEISFSGVLQWSVLPGSGTWSDVTPAPASPYMVPRAEMEEQKFFRARTP